MMELKYLKISSMSVIILMILFSGCKSSTSELTQAVTSLTASASSENGDYGVVGGSLVFIAANQAGYAIDNDTATFWSPIHDKPSEGSTYAYTDQVSHIVFLSSDTHHFSKISLHINGDSSDSDLASGSGRAYSIEFWDGDNWVVADTRQHGAERDTVEQITLGSTYETTEESTALRLHYTSTYGHVPVVNEVSIEEIISETSTVWIWNGGFWSE